MALAQGVVKQTRFKRQTAKGTLAGASGGQILRRKTSTFELVKDTYTTQDEITSTQQLLSNRHGVRTVNGAINGILSAGTYSDMVSAVLRRDYAAVTTISGASITVAGSGPYTLTDGANTFLTKGVKIGMVIRLTAGSFNAANLNKNLLVTAVSQTVITVQPVNGVALAAEGPIASATVSIPGKVTYTPITGHTNVYYTIEEWYSDVPSSERNQDVKISKVDLKLPGTGNAEIDITAVGLDQSSSATVYYTSPTTETSTGALVAASGLLYVNGTAQAVITDLSFSIDGNEQPADGVVGANIRPDIFRGKVMITGQFTAYFDSTTIPDLFRNETVTSISSVLAADTTGTADFIALYLAKLDLNTSSPDDGETGLKRTYSFVCEYNSAGGSGQTTEQTSLWIQDSQA